MINDIAFGMTWPIFGAWFYQIAYRYNFPVFGWHPWPFLKDWAAIAMIEAIFATVGHYYVLCACGVASFIIAMTIWWWRHSRKRRRASKVIGEKARALRAVMVRKMRELTRPRRVLRPLPQPA